jgi:hypothetical protein
LLGAVLNFNLTIKNWQWILKHYRGVHTMHFLAIVKCFCVFLFLFFRVFVSCRVWAKNQKKLFLNSKQLIKHENTKTLNYGQKVRSVYSPLVIIIIITTNLLWLYF